MKWLSKKKGNDEVSYWQTIADILSGLLLLILLISLLLVLYILRIPEETEIDPDPGNYTYETDSRPGDHRYEDPGNHYSDGGHGIPWETRIVTNGGGGYAGGGGGGGSGGGDPGNGKTGEGDYEYQEPGWGDYEGTEKSAVYVRLLDAETGKVIREKDVVFTLAYPSGKAEMLTVYYPEKITYKEYATTEQGTFYLPDKVRLGEHHLKEQTEPYGYDASEEVTFTIEESHDWDEPYVVDVSLFPSRNVIRVLQTDAATGKPLSGGRYRITAAEDIITADGTLRYHAGDVMEEIECDADGLAVSQEVYLGNYTVTQILPPECYAAADEPVAATVEKKQQGKLPEAHVFACEQTAFSLVLVDELERSEKIADVSFAFRKEGEALTQSFVTNRNGTIRLTGLTPETTYHLTQESVAPFYAGPCEEVTFTVDARGLIDGESAKRVEVTNRMLRTTVLIRDALLRRPIVDRAVSLFDGEGNCIAQWTSYGNAHELNGLTPGEYRIRVAGASKEMTINVTDQAEVQVYEFNIMTNEDLIGLGAVGVVLIGLGVFLVIRIIRKRREKPQERR